MQKQEVRIIGLTGYYEGDGEGAIYQIKIFDKKAQKGIEEELRIRTSEKNYKI